eukprot:s130_g41.t1
MTRIQWSRCVEVRSFSILEPTTAGRTFVFGKAAGIEAAPLLVAPVTNNRPKYSHFRPGEKESMCCPDFLLTSTILAPFDLLRRSEKNTSAADCKESTPSSLDTLGSQKNIAKKSNQRRNVLDVRCPKSSYADSARHKRNRDTMALRSPLRRVRWTCGVFPVGPKFGGLGIIPHPSIDVPPGSTSMLLQPRRRSSVAIQIRCCYARGKLISLWRDVALARQVRQDQS